MSGKEQEAYNAGAAAGYAEAQKEMAGKSSNFSEVYETQSKRIEELEREIAALREAVRNAYCKNTSGWVCHKDQDGLPSRVAIFLHAHGEDCLVVVRRALEEKP